MTNIKFYYEYRDAGGNRRGEEVVFCNNKKRLNLRSIEDKIRSYLFDREFFYPHFLSLPSLYFDKYDPVLDHVWYRFEKIELTNELVTDERSFDEFIMCIKRNAKRSF